MNNTPKECMTIVVPVFNRPVLVKRCLDSIYAQTYRPLSLIVVDNASTDDSLRVVEDWGERHFGDDFSVRIISDSRRGAAYARQTGLDHVVTDKVMFFDSDDVMRPECVDTVMGMWRSRPDAKIVAWPILRHKESGDRKTHSIKGDLLERHLVHAILQTQGYAIKTHFLRSVGGWKGEYSNWNDYETGVRILLRTSDVIPVDVPLADVYPQADSITGTSFSSKAGLWEKSLDGVEASIRERGRTDVARLLCIVAYRRAILAADYAKEGRLDLARPLYSEALSNVPAKKKAFIRFAYHWTRLGLRGAFSIIGRFL